MTDQTLHPGSIGTIRVAVLALDGDQASIEVIDNNNQPVSGATSIPAGLITPTETLVAVGDVLQNVASLATLIVCWVSADGLTWSSSANGGEPQSTVGWTRIGTFKILS